MKKIKIYSIVLSVILVLSVSCEKDFEEMNINPSQPTETTMNYQFTNLFRNSADGGTEWYSLQLRTIIPWVRAAGLPNEVIDDVSGDPRGIDSYWSSYFGKLRDLNALLIMIDEYSQSIEGGEKLFKNRKAMVMIFRAYWAFRTTDMFGDMPYFEAGNATDGVFRAKYDSQEDIYKDLLTQLGTAVDMIDTDFSDFSKDEQKVQDYDINKLYIGGGDAVEHLEKWKKFGNALRLKYALRMYEVDQSTAGSIISDCLGKPLPESNNDIFAYIPRRVQPDGSHYKNSALWGIYYYPSTQPGQYAYGIFAETPNDTSTIFDPRLYAYMAPTKDNDYVAIPENQDKFSNEGWELSYGMGTDGEWTQVIPKPYGGAGTTSEYNRIYFCGLHRPTFHMTYAEVCFIKAEIFERGIAGGDAKTEYDNGVKAAINEMLDPLYVQFYDQNTDWHIDIPSDTEIENNILSGTKMEYGTDNLKLIYKQRWAEYLQRPNEQWSLVRRVGVSYFDFPEILSGGTPLSMPGRLTYPQSELEYNSVNYSDQLSKMGGVDQIHYKVWWMK